MLLVVWLLACGASAETPEARAERLSSRKLHGDSMFDTSSHLDEAGRRARFRQVHGSWPDARWVAREQPSYSRAMAAREVRAQALTDSQARWDAWMFIAQARMLDNFTSAQWEVVDAPAAIHAKLLARLDQGRATARRESATGVLSGVHGPNAADFVAQEALNYEVLDALLPLHEAWCNCELEPTSVYGVRLYREGATLIDHLDVPETHVISSILHIDSKLRAPFPIEIEDASGAYASVSLEPGQMMFYESAKCFHRRSVPMQGDYYGSLFLHYRPKRWTFSRDDIRVAVPPFWADGLGRTDDSARAQEEDAAAAAAAAVLLPGESATLTVELDAASEPPAWPVVLEWLRPGTRERVPVAIATKDDSQQLLQTFVGHEWLVTDAHGAQLAALTIDQRETRLLLRAQQDAPPRPHSEL